METTVVVRENWLTKKPRHNGWMAAAFLFFVLYSSNLLFFNDYGDWLPASRNAVFNQHEYYKAWTALFAHADLGHFLSNIILFIPLAYLLTSYYGYLFFPLAGLFFGGVTNLIVLQTMPLETSLLGISGVVYWMGAAWLTLFTLIDRRHSFRRRLAIAVFLSVILFVPETYKPEISYLSHFVGFAFGILASLLYYHLYRGPIEAAEVREYVSEDVTEPLTD